MKRNFNKWFGTFRKSIAGYDYYVDFPKVFANVDAIRIPLNILNSLVGSRNIREDFIHLVEKYPEVLRCIPILLAVRNLHIHAIDDRGTLTYCFSRPSHSPEDYAYFMEKTGLFSLLSSHIIRVPLDLGGKGFVTSCGLIQLGAAADVEIRLDGIELIRGFDYEIEALFSLAIVGDLGHVYPKLRLDLRNAHLLEVGDIS